MKPFLLFILFNAYYFISLRHKPAKTHFSGYIGTLSGKVMDSATGKGLPGASIYIADLKLGAVRMNTAITDSPISLPEPTW